MENKERLSAVQFTSVALSCPTLCDPMYCSTLGFPVLHCLQSLLKLMPIESMMLSNHLILYWPLLLLPSIFSSIRVFFSESALHIRWPNCWSFGFSISPSNDYSGLISFKIDWFDLPSVQGILKSLPQYHNSKASILWHSASLWSNSHILNDYCKNHSFDYTDFVSKVMSLLFSSLVHINKTSQSWETLSMYILRILRYEKYDKQ